MSPPDHRHSDVVGGGSSPLPCAIIGPGYFGKHYVRITRSRPEFYLKYIYRGKPEYVQELLDKFPDQKLSEAAQRQTTHVDSLETILSDPEIQAVFVTTPVETHYDIVKSCLQAKKHVYVEKPLTSSHTKAVELLYLAEQQRLVLLCGHTPLYTPGAVWTVEAFAKQRSAPGDGDLVLAGLHTIYAKRTNLGPVKVDGSLPERTVQYPLQRWALPVYWWLHTFTAHLGQTYILNKQNANTSIKYPPMLISENFEYVHEVPSDP